MSAEHFESMFAGCLTVAVYVKTDEVFAGGPSRASLKQGFRKKDLDLSSFQFEPGPVPAEVKSLPCLSENEG
jgi:hypothetical protein